MSTLMNYNCDGRLCLCVVKTHDAERCKFFTRNCNQSNCDFEREGASMHQIAKRTVHS